MRRNWLIYFVSAPLIFASWPVLLVMYLLWGQNPFWDVGIWFELKPNSWPARTWYRRKIKGEYVENGFHPEIFGKWITWGGTTLGLGGFIGPGRTDDELMSHERVHLDQYIVGCILGLIAAVAICIFTGDAFISLSAWSCVPYLYFVASFALAWMRGANKPMELYRNSTHELYARAVRKCYEDGDEIA